MANHFITIAELEYEQANYLRRELQLENILAFIDFTGSDSGSLDKRIVRLQVQGKLVAKAIQALIKIVRKLNINSLNDLGEEQLKKSTTILVPVDLSERSEIVGKYAIKLASAIGAGIKFHHVYFESDGVSSSAAYEGFISRRN